MNPKSDPRLVRILERCSTAASLFSMAIGLSALSGWIFHIAILKSWLPGAVSVRFNAAICCVLLGFSLFVLRRASSGTPMRSMRRAAKIAACAVMLVGLISLLENLFGWNLGIDQFLRTVGAGEEVGTARAGLIPLVASISFALLGGGLFILDWKTRAGDWPAQFLASVSAVASVFGILDFVLGRHVSHTHVALPGAMNFMIVSLGVISARPEWAMGGLLISSSSGARWLRRTVPGALAVLAGFGWLLAEPLLTTAHLSWMETSLVAISAGLVLGGIVGWTAVLLERSEQKLEVAEQALHLPPEKLSELMNRCDESPVETGLRRWTVAGIVVGVLLAGLGGFDTWRSMQQAAEGANWVAHTHNVNATLEATLAHVADVESGTRGFAATGESAFLEPFVEEKHAIYSDLDSLVSLVADNPAQMRRLQKLRPQVEARVQTAEDTVTERRRTRKVPASTFFLLGKKQMDAVRATIAEMQSEEAKLLDQRIRRADEARNRTATVILLTSVIGVGMLLLAGTVTQREIRRNAKTRGQIQALNASLERRVEERTTRLRESRQRFEGIIESAMDAILSTDEGHKIVLFNPAAEKMFGYESSQVLGRPLNLLIPERYRESHPVHIRQFGETNISRRMGEKLGQLWGLRADGREFPLEVSISRIEVAGRRLFTAIVRDITDRVQAEHRLQASETKYRTLFESIVEGFCIIEVLFDDRIAAIDYRFLEISPSFASQTGLMDAHGKRMRELSPDHEEHWFQTFGRVALTGEPAHLENYVARNRHWYDVHASRVGNPLERKVAVVFSDITARKAAEDALRESEQRLRLFIDHAPVALAMFDREMRYLAVSRRWLADYGFDDRDLRGVSHYEVFPEVPERWKEAHRRGLAGEVLRQENERFERADGSAQWIRWEIRPWCEAGGKVGGIVIFTEDTSEHRKAAEQIRRLNEELERRVVERTAQLAAANKELEAFTYSVSHDLRAPLRHISGFSKILMEEFGPTLAPDAQHHLQRIQDGTRRMGLLVDDLLNLGRVGRQEVRRQVTGLHSLVDEVISELQPECQDRQVEWKVGDLPFVECDPGLLKQVFQNLLANAVKFTRPRAAARIEVGQQETNGAPTVFVRDNGVGFSMKYSDKLFGVFQRLHRQEDFEGTGVGLATVQRIVQKHGGRIWAEAELDKGAAFYFTLGRSEGVGKSEGAESKAKPEVLGGAV